jgi:high-affinity iron transporter
MKVRLMTLTNPMPPKLTPLAALLTCALTVAGWSLVSGAAMDASLGKPATADEQDPGDHAHADAANLTNPVKSTPASIATGKALFERQCVSCHGAMGAGDGKSAAQLKPPPADLTDATWKHGASDGEIYTLIKDGSKNTAMKGFASKMTAQEMWSIVNYIRTLQVH